MNQQEPWYTESYVRRIVLRHNEIFDKPHFVEVASFWKSRMLMKAETFQNWYIFNNLILEFLNLKTLEFITC